MRTRFGMTTHRGSNQVVCIDGGWAQETVIRNGEKRKRVVPVGARRHPRVIQGYDWMQVLGALHACAWGKSEGSRGGLASRPLKGCGIVSSHATLLNVLLNGRLVKQGREVLIRFDCQGLS